jgi:hypothetical protein
MSAAAPAGIARTTAAISPRAAQGKLATSGPVARPNLSAVVTVTLTSDPPRHPRNVTLTAPRS